VEQEGRRLVNRAAFLREVRDARSPLENLLARYDRALREIAALMDVTLAPTVTGDQARRACWTCWSRIAGAGRC
jgi:hypothetical protein